MVLKLKRAPNIGKLSRFTTDTSLLFSLVTRHLKWHKMCRPARTLSSIENIQACSNCVLNNGSFVSHNGTSGIKPHCDRYYSLFSDSGGCCAGYNKCQSVARDTLYVEVLNCHIVSLCVVGAVVLMSHYLQIVMSRCTHATPYIPSNRMLRNVLFLVYS